MSFTYNSSPKQKYISVKETITGPNNTTVYSSEIGFVTPDLKVATKKIGVAVIASAVTTNLTLDIYGDYGDGTKVLLVSNALSGNIGTTTPSVYQLDLNACPAAKYYLGIKSTADNSGNTVTARVFASK